MCALRRVAAADKAPPDNRNAIHLLSGQRTGMLRFFINYIALAINAMI
jgi:hypothetical protein